jgi:protein-S-isoprenylcysteine O-methyltransferase Ste14
VRAFILAALFPLALFGAAGRVDWPMGWVYVVLTVGITLGGRYWMLRRNPALFDERSQALGRDDTKSWDKIIVPIVGVLGPFAQVIVAGLDMRFGWSPPFPLWLVVVGIALLLVGYVFATWAMLVNAFYSSAVRIQTDRGQYVISDGPYRFVRHPSYIGAVIGNLGASLMLTSLWSLIPMVLVTIVLLIRTSLEDATLQEELPGYREYAQKTTARWIPGVW